MSNCIWMYISENLTTTLHQMHEKFLWNTYFLFNSNQKCTVHLLKFVWKLNCRLHSNICKLENVNRLKIIACNESKKFIWIWFNWSVQVCMFVDKNNSKTDEQWKCKIKCWFGQYKKRTHGNRMVNIAISFEYRFEVMQERILNTQSKHFPSFTLILFSKFLLLKVEIKKCFRKWILWLNDQI